MKTLVMRVSGMTCEGCVENLNRLLLVTPGVHEVNVDLMSRTARVVHDEAVCKPSDVTAAVRRAGYQVDQFETVEVIQ